MKIELCDQLNTIPTSDWNALDGCENPFLRHEFLTALEECGCVSQRKGWLPQHLIARDKNSDRLVGAVPLYLKTHSYGEYVFDWAWANAYAQAGLNYYPKLVAAVPFTPVTGARLLLAPGVNHSQVSSQLIQAARDHTVALGASSLHWLFCRPSELSHLESHDHLRRTGYQFRWQNQGYHDFADFLKTLNAKKRKNIRAERRTVQNAGVSLEVLTGAEITPAIWETFYGFYHDTIRNHSAVPYLNLSFFQAIGRHMPEQIVLIMARHGKAYVAGALNLRGRDTLYGRYWGSTQTFDKLHFETCYYRAIEYCIEHGLQHFEAGAQGEHKLARGLLPNPTYSAHWLSHPEFSRAIADYLQHEQNGVEYYMDKLSSHSPFRQKGTSDSR